MKEVCFHFSFFLTSLNQWDKCQKRQIFCYKQPKKILIMYNFMRIKKSKLYLEEDKI